jgi:protocatechuate 3,4-dioxygenase beta subunit
MASVEVCDATTAQKNYKCRSQKNARKKLWAAIKKKDGLNNLSTLEVQFLTASKTLCKMKRQKFLSLIGFGFAGSLFFSAKDRAPKILVTDCDDPITPPVPEGPFYKDEKLNRIDITETKTGTPLEYIFRVEDEHCKPIPGAIVDIWQCDTEGVYSDFKQENTVNETWLRGYQITDKNGMCRFKSIFPGWYDGRITHLHAKVHIENKTVLTTNFFFPKQMEDEIYNSNASQYPKGINPTSVLQDIELKVDKDTKRHDVLLMKLEKDHKGNLSASYTIAVV